MNLGHRSESNANVTGEVSLFDVLMGLARRKRLLFGVPLTASIVAALISLVLPSFYTASTRILPPQQSQSTSLLLLGQIGASGSSAVAALKNPSDLFVAMLKSRKVADRLVERFKLRQTYGADLMEDAREKLGRRTAINASRDGVIRIDVEERDPKLAAALANGYVDELRRLLVELTVSEAGSRRIFFEQQLRKAKDELANAEVALRAFQQKSNVLDPQSQAGLTVAAAANLRAQIAAKQVQVSALKAFATDQNPELLRALREIDGIKAQLGRLESDARTGRGDVLVSIDQAANLSGEYLQRYRDVKYYDALFELLAKQY